jgi:hypothetical protein
MQPPDRSAMAPLKPYHNQKLDIVHCLIGFPPATTNAVIGTLALNGYAFTSGTWKSVPAAVRQKYLPEACKILRAKPR